MQVKDVMNNGVLAVTPDTTVLEIATLMANNGISAVPVTDDDNKLVGIVSEGDLIHRQETDTGRRRSRWLKMLAQPGQRAEDYIKSHGRRAADVMTRNVVTVSEDESLVEVAELLEKHHIKRVPVLNDGRLIGIISRANLVQALAVSGRHLSRATERDDLAIRDKILSAIKNDIELPAGIVNVIVEDGVVHLWGAVDAAAEKRAVEIAAENQPGVKRVESRLSLLSEIFNGGF